MVEEGKDRSSSIPIPGTTRSQLIDIVHDPTNGMHAVNDVVVPGKLAKMAIYGSSTRAPLDEIPSLRSWRLLQRQSCNVTILHHLRGRIVVFRFREARDADGF
jgi:hypothetical protein